METDGREDWRDVVEKIGERRWRWWERGGREGWREVVEKVRERWWRRLERGGDGGRIVVER